MKTMANRVQDLHRTADDLMAFLSKNQVRHDRVFLTTNGRKSTRISASVSQHEIRKIKLQRAPVDVTEAEEFVHHAFTYDVYSVVSTSSFHAGWMNEFKIHNISNDVSE